MNELPYVAPPQDGLSRAFADARARRLRKASLSTTSVAAVLSSLALLAGGQGTQSLVQQPAPEQPAVARLLPDRAAPSPATGQPNRAAGVQLFGTTQRGSVRAVGGPGTAAQRATGDRPTTDRHTGARTNGPTYWPGSISRADNQAGFIPTDTACAVPSRPGEPPQLCTAAYVMSTSNTGPYELQAQVCSSRTGLTLLHYPGRNEVDLSVTRGTSELWRWSRWHPDDPAAHTIGVEANSCTTWTFSWTGVDAQGRRLPKGEYTLRATFLADELTQQRVATWIFQLP